ncbi:MAG: amino acid permease [Gemmatimonadetes bacterium]|uniref:Amino acid permease n=1 Tax=Candidatus Kutchimonas denitrificans TaxID=3056748 RepID=A0AAE4Z8N7_9BACT|nr:amino acid permease [Gemmatimonadota bacterium]NIR75043.1 amino acid permease [Candidatus Kutchimonas denitrificans]NIS02863.1 amino acid permease [Gemmatimonadota bacterium]NIT68568.1 amino acid permease [Gemmatimonadota bacterium]NIU52813.1 amino acid permease [Gemmatimonadota bacterium]
MSFRRALGPFDATMVVIGGIIGAGIFINPYIVAQRLDTPGLVLVGWLAGGAIALAGAFAFAELGSLFPKAGGHYAYLRDAYHPFAGFLYGWALLLMIECGAIAAVAITFAEYALRFVGRPDAPALPLAIAAIAVVATINYLGVKPGSRTLNVFVILKTLALVLLIGAGLILPVDAPAAGPGSTGTPGAPTGSPSLLIAFGAALVPIMFSYGGWQNVNYVAEEIREPQRDIPIAAIAGTAVVVTVYALVNFVYLDTLGHRGLAGTMTPAADTVNALLGSAGDRLIALTIAVSTFGFLDLTMLAPTRVYYAMAADGVFFRGVARLHPRFQTPSLAIVLQTVWAIALALTGTYAQLVDYVVFADWIFFGLAAGAVFVFRRKYPLARRPAGTFRSPGYPWLPGTFVLASIWIVASVIGSNPVRTGLGMVLLATGVPTYLFWRGKARMVNDR